MFNMKFIKLFVIFILICAAGFGVAAGASLLSGGSLSVVRAAANRDQYHAQQYAAAASTTSLSIVFAGDIMLDRNVYRAILRDNKNFAHPFLRIDELLSNFDLRVANLEGPFTAAAFNMKRAEAMSFTFDSGFAPELAKRFDVVSLANNHTYNFNEKGLASTKDILKKNGTQYFGDPLNRVGLIGTIIEKNGFKIGVVGYHAFAGPEAQNIPNVVAAIKALRPKVDFLVVMPHWGVEYKPKPSLSQIAAGHAFILAGADAVIGGHPHVVETVEQYKGHPIYYSMGNFIFDQYFSPETQRGILVHVALNRVDGRVVPMYETIPYQISGESQPFLP